MTRPQEWARFEDAVAAFLAALAPGASVKANVKLPDRDTGLPRQRDVWIEARLLGQFPISILVSCKRYRRRLNQQDIDAFEGERRSAGAQLGVLYAYGGFSKPALKKAAQLGISCCRLFTDAPAEIPPRLLLPCFCFGAEIQITPTAVSGPRNTVVYWRDLLNAAVRDEEGGLVIDRLSQAYQALESRGMEHKSPNGVPSDWAVEISLPLLHSQISMFAARITVRWRIFQGKLNAYLLNGSYSESTQQFAGSVTFPIVDIAAAHPGDGWALYDQPMPDTFPGYLLVYRYGADPRVSLLEQLGSRPFTFEDASGQSGDSGALAREA